MQPTDEPSTASTTNAANRWRSMNKSVSMNLQFAPSFTVLTNAHTGTANAGLAQILPAIFQTFGSFLCKLDTLVQYCLLFLPQILCEHTDIF
jgi:hypothetical protein